MKRINLLVCAILISCFTLLSLGSKAQYILLAQNFDTSTVFPPTGWQNNLINNAGTDDSGPLVWVLGTAGSPLSSGGGDANISSAHSGNYFAGWNSWDIESGGSADLVTPAMDLSQYPGGANVLTVWSYRLSSDPVTVYVNTVPNTTGGSPTSLATFNSYTSGWTLSTLTIPTTYTGIIYIIFHGKSNYGSDDFIDDVVVTHNGCFGTPTASTITTPVQTTPACSGTTVSLQATEVNTVSGNTISGITEYWQQSACATGPWVTAIGGNGVHSTTYTTPLLTGSIYYRFADTCSNTKMGANSTPYYVQVNLSTAIATQPANNVVCSGNNAVFTVGAVGGSLTYQWQLSSDNGAHFTNITNVAPYSGATNDTLNIIGVPLAFNDNQYRCVVTGSCGAPAISNGASVYVGPPPGITHQAHDTLVCEGNTATFFTTDTGINLNYQWMVDKGTGFGFVYNGAGYTGANTNKLIITNTPASYNGYKYELVITGACNPVTSIPHTLNVNALPRVTTQPTNTSVCVGSNTSVSVAATGAGLSYQWQVSTGGAFANVPTSHSVYGGSTTNTLSITNAVMSMNGYVYRAIISGTCTPMDTTNVDTLVVHALPVTGIRALGSSPYICPTDTTLFAGLIAPGYTYQWYYNGTAITRNATNDTFKANPAGGYSVLITNNFGCSAFSPADTVYYLPAPVVAITAGSATGFCLGGSVTLTGPTYAGVTYAWKLNGNYITGATNPIDTFYVSGSYTLYENNGTCGTTSAPIVVTASSIPQVSILSTSGGTFCPGQTVALQANTGSASTAGYTYLWSLNGAAQPGNTSTFTAGTAGNYTVQVASGPGCITASSAYPLSVLPAPTAVITPTSSLSFCPGSVSVLNANAQTNVTYQWYGNNTPITGANAPAYSAGVAASYTVVITGANGCATTSNTLTVTALPSVSAPVASSKSDTLCAPDSLVLFSPAVTGVTYQWYNNSVAITDSTRDSLVVHNAGSYSLTVANTGCSATSGSINVAVGTTPTGTISFGRDSSICGAIPAILQAPVGADYAYQWYVGGSPIQNSFSQYYVASTPGSYTVVITTSLGCSLTTPAATITIGTVPTPSSIIINNNGAGDLCTSGFTSYQWYFNNTAIPNATSSCTPVVLPGGYTVIVTNSTGCSATSNVFDVQNTAVSNVNLKNNISIFPNPASSVIYIDAPAAVNVIVTGIDGKEMIRAEKAKAINIETLAPGMYMLSVYDQDNNLLKTEKVVKN